MILILVQIVGVQVFKTHLFLSPVVFLGVPVGNKFLFASENTLVQNQWPGSVVELLGPHSLATKVGEEHKYANLGTVSRAKVSSDFKSWVVLSWSFIL